MPAVDDVVVDDDDGVGDEDRVRLIASSSSSRMNVASTPSNLSWSSSRTTALGLTRSMTERTSSADALPGVCTVPTT